MEVLAALLGSTLGIVAALCFVVLLLCWPILTLYAFYRIIRDVGRIADALEQTTTGSVKTVRRQLAETQPVVVSESPAVANSMFGR